MNISTFGSRININTTNDYFDLDRIQDVQTFRELMELHFPGLVKAAGVRDDHEMLVAITILCEFVGYDNLPVFGHKITHHLNLLYNYMMANKVMYHYWML